MPKISVASRPESFRRAGFRFTREPRELEVDETTLKLLAGEPELRVRVVEPAKTAKTAKTAAGSRDRSAGRAANGKG